MTGYILDSPYTYVTNEVIENMESCTILIDSENPNGFVEIERPGTVSVSFCPSIQGKPEMYIYGLSLDADVPASASQIPHNIYTFLITCDQLVRDPYLTGQWWIRGNALPAFGIDSDEYRDLEREPETDFWPLDDSKPIDKLTFNFITDEGKPLNLIRVKFALKIRPRGRGITPKGSLKHIGTNDRLPKEGGRFSINLDETVKN
jgi:hypothetical protein